MVLVEIVILLVLVALLVKVTRRNTLAKNAPPLVREGWTPFGALAQMEKDQVGFLRKCQEKYGDVFTVDYLLHKQTFLCGVDGAHEIFRSVEEKMSLEKSMEYFLRGLIGYENPWPTDKINELRNKLQHTLHKLRDPFFTKISKECQASFAEWKEKGTIELCFEVERLIANIYALCLFGEEARGHADSLRDLFDDLLTYGMSALVIMFPWLPFGTPKKCYEIREKITKILVPIIRERRKNKHQDHPDYLNEFIQFNRVDGQEWSEEDILIAAIQVFTNARSHNLKTCMWNLITLHAHPESGTRARAELDRVIETEGKLSEASIRKLPHLENHFRETMRIYTPTCNGMRLVQQPYEFKGYTIPKGHYAMMVNATINRDSNFFPESEKFVPERYETPDVNPAHVFFGLGSHRCKGEFFATEVMKTIWSIFLLNYHLEFEDGKPPLPAYLHFSNIPYPAGKTMVRITKRR